MKKLYQTAILRYMHDVVSGECMNIGTLLYSREAAFLKVKINHKYSRLSKAFLTFDSGRYNTFVTSLEKSINRLAREIENQPDTFQFKQLPDTIDSLLLDIIAPDETSFRFHSVGGGLSADLEKSFEKLYERYVLLNNVDNPRVHKDDGDIWKEFTDIINDKTIAKKFTPQKINTPELEIEFKHCWKNGRINAYQPLALDLIDPQAIEDKVCKWHSKLYSIADNNIDVNVCLLVGMPQTQELRDKAKRNLELIYKSKIIEPISNIIFEEEQGSFAEKVKQQIIAHDLE